MVGDELTLPTTYHLQPPLTDMVLDKRKSVFCDGIRLNSRECC